MISTHDRATAAERAALDPAVSDLSRGVRAVYDMAHSFRNTLQFRLNAPEVRVGVF